MEIVKTDISKKIEFDRIGYHYTRVWFDEVNHIGVYKMIGMNPYEQYEVVKGVKRQNPDGTTVYVYPSDEMFGTYGYYVCGTAERCKEQIEKYVNKLMSE